MAKEVQMVSCKTAKLVVSESAQEDDIFGEGSEAVDSTDTDNDGLSDILESSQYGTDPNDPDTDGDSLLDGWEVANGLNPLDNGDSEEVEEVTETIDDSDDVEVSEEDDSWPIQIKVQMVIRIMMD